MRSSTSTIDSNSQRNDEVFVAVVVVDAFLAEKKTDAVGWRGKIDKISRVLLSAKHFLSPFSCLLCLFFEAMGFMLIMMNFIIHLIDFERGFGIIFIVFVN